MTLWQLFRLGEKRYRGWAGLLMCPAAFVVACWMMAVKHHEPVQVDHLLLSALAGLLLGAFMWLNDLSKGRQAPQEDAPPDEAPLAATDAAERVEFRMSQRGRRWLWLFFCPLSESAKRF